MIVTEIYKGQGLGNQLWCYITTRVMAKDKGYNFGIQSPEKFKCNDFMKLDFGQPVIGGTSPEGGPPLTLPKGITHYYKERKITHPGSGADISAYDNDLLNIPDNTKVDGNMQDEQYVLHRKDEIREWLKVDERFECYDFSDDNICVINFRGGEYVHIKNVFLPQKYWDDAIRQMLKINKNFRFVVITDDVKTAKKFFPKFDVFHFNITKDYVIVKNAKYLILANSSFAWFPAWLNENLKFCIAPKYWWAHNISDGYWACDYNITKGWRYLDRGGNLQDYDKCLQELNEFKKHHKQYYIPEKIKNNFLVISNYNNEISWVSERSENYLIYDKGETNIHPYTVDQKKIIKSPNIGYNLYDYFTFIIDHYDDLPDCTIFTKGNIFPRHITKEYFDRISNNNFFTPIEDYRMHKTKWPVSFFSADGGFCEINNSWYLNHHPIKYFSNYNDFLKFCFKDPVIPRYIRFAPGGNYIVPKENILKLPKMFYDNLRTFISYCPLPGEAHIVERSLYTLWTSNFEINEKMLHPLNVDTLPKLIRREKNIFKKSVDFLLSINKKNTFLFLKKHLPLSMQEAGFRFLNKTIKAIKKIYPLTNLQETVNGLMANTTQISKKKLSSMEIAEYRKTIKVYDCFYFFNELELLEIRLNILDPYIDYFVIMEATETFSGLPKKLIFEENKEKFKKFEHKIIHYVTSDTPVSEDDLRKRLYNKDINALDKEIVISSLTSDNVPKGQLHWLKEFYQKECLKKALAQIGLSDNDICFISDVDEIWNPEIIVDYSADDLYKYKQDSYYYYLNNRSNDYWVTGWTGTVMTKHKNIKNNCLNHLRTHTKNKYTVIKNGGWHFTFQGGADKIRRKLESYGHLEFNTKEIRSQIENVLSENRDYRGRKLKFWIDETNMPKYLLSNKSKYYKLFK